MFSTIKVLLQKISARLPVSSRRFSSEISHQTKQQKQIKAALDNILKALNQQKEDINAKFDKIQSCISDQENCTAARLDDICKSLRQHTSTVDENLRLIQDEGISCLTTQLNYKREFSEKAQKDNHFILFDYAYPGKTRVVNMGDNIQTIALKEALTSLFPDCSFTYWDRDDLINYDGAPAKCIYQGWLSHGGFNFLPSKKIYPIFLGSHFCEDARKKIRFIHRETAFFRGISVGCRDLSTQNFCRKIGINAYFSRCLSLTFPKIETPRGSQFYLVNIPDEIERMFPVEVTKNAIRINQKDAPFADFPTRQIRFDHAEKLLSMYASASCVITTAIHCAMPCIAMGVPVILINMQKKPAEFERYSVLSGIYKAYTVNDVAEHKIDFSPDPIDIEPLKGLILENLKQTIMEAKGETIDNGELNDLRRCIAEFSCFRK